MRLTTLFLASALFAGPAIAQDQDDPLAPLDQAPAPRQSIVQPIVQPVTPPPPPRIIPKDWRGIFAAIDSGDWEGARLGIDAMPADPLRPLAKAELSTHDNQRVTKALNDGLQAALTGTKTPEVAMKDAQREAERLLRTYK